MGRLEHPHSNLPSGERQRRGERQRLEHELRAELDLPAASRDTVALNERVLYAELSYDIVGAAMEVHRHLGPGKLESTYQGALDQELALRGIARRAQVPIALAYKGRQVGQFYLDFVVEERVVVELKAVDRRHAVHRAQVLSYLHATKLRLGLLIKFNVPLLCRGVERVVL